MGALSVFKLREKDGNVRAQFIKSLHAVRKWLGSLSLPSLVRPDVHQVQTHTIFQWGWGERQRERGE